MDWLQHGETLLDVLCPDTLHVLHTSGGIMFEVLNAVLESLYSEAGKGERLNELARWTSTLPAPDGLHGRMTFKPKRLKNAKNFVGKEIVDLFPRVMLALSLDHKLIEDEEERASVLGAMEAIFHLHRLLQATSFKEDDLVRYHDLVLAFDKAGQAAFPSEWRLWVSRPKFHQLQHFGDFIREQGAAALYAAGEFERVHQEHKKEFRRYHGRGEVSENGAIMRQMYNKYFLAKLKVSIERATMVDRPEGVVQKGDLEYLGYSELLDLKRDCASDLDFRGLGSWTKECINDLTILTCRKTKFFMHKRRKFCCDLRRAGVDWMPSVEDVTQVGRAVPGHIVTVRGDPELQPQFGPWWSGLVLETYKLTRPAAPVEECNSPENTLYVARVQWLKRVDDKDKPGPPVEEIEVMKLERSAGGLTQGVINLTSVEQVRWAVQVRENWGGVTDARNAASRYRVALMDDVRGTLVEADE